MAQVHRRDRDILGGVSAAMIALARGLFRPDAEEHRSARQHALRFHEPGPRCDASRSMGPPRTRSGPPPSFETRACPGGGKFVPLDALLRMRAECPRNLVATPPAP